MLYKYLIFLTFSISLLNINAKNIIRNSTLSPASEIYYNQICNCIEKSGLKDKEIIIVRIDGFDILSYDGISGTVDNATYSEGSIINYIRAIASPAAIYPNFIHDKTTGYKPVFYFCLDESYFNKLSNKEKEAIIYHEIGHIYNNHLSKLKCWNTSLSLLSFITSQCLLYKFFKLFSKSKVNEDKTVSLAFRLSNNDIKDFFKKQLCVISGLGSIALISRLIKMYKSRQFEYEADEFSFKQIKDASAFKALFNRWNKIKTKPSGLAKLLITHPTPDERIDAIEKLDKKQKKKINQKNQYN